MHGNCIIVKHQNMKIIKKHNSLMINYRKRKKILPYKSWILGTLTENSTLPGFNIFRKFLFVIHEEDLWHICGDSCTCEKNEIFLLHNYSCSSCVGLPKLTNFLSIFLGTFIFAVHSISNVFSRMTHASQLCNKI